MKDHWTEYTPVIIRFPIAALIAIVGALLIPQVLINRVEWMRNTKYRLSEIFSETKY